MVHCVMVYVVTYGCKVNHYESVQVRSLLNGAGIECELAAEKDITKITAPAPVFVVNSCAVTGMAEKKSRYGVSKIKKYFPAAKIISAGCAFNRKTPEQIVFEITGKNIAGGIVMHKREKAFIKVQDGCKNFCSFCIIPYKRTVLECRPVADVVAEINAQPPIVSEIIISGINLCYYPDIIALARAVDKCGRRWSFSSVEPPLVTPEFVAALHSCRNFEPKFHICLQSASDRVLHDMNRHYTAAEYLEKINTVRKSFPSAKISTDIIVGYPTENADDFSATVEFIKTVGFAAVHIFPYSPRSGTAAAKLKPLTNSLVTKRFNMLRSICENTDDETDG